MKLRILFAVLFLFCVLAVPTKADTFDVSGRLIYGGNSADWAFQGPNFGVGFGPLEGPSFFGAFCQEGSICDVSKTIAACCAEILSVNGNLISISPMGSLTFNGTAAIPIAPGFGATIPVWVSGTLTIIESMLAVTDHGVFVTGQEVFEITPVGPGLLTLNGVSVGPVVGSGNCDGTAACIRMLQGTYNFDAEVTEVPEPASLLLFASGLVGIGALLRQRRRKSLRSSKV